MHKLLTRTLLEAAAALLLATPALLQAQADTAPAAPAHQQTIAGVVSATLPSGATLRGAGATVYLWPDAPELRSAIDAACVAAKARPTAWIEARTELESPSGMPLDSAAASDIAILQRVAAIPHATTRADSAGRFILPGVPMGDYWIEAEMMQGSGIVQWWHKLSLDPVDLVAARILSRIGTHAADAHPADSHRTEVRAVPAMVMGTRDFTRDEFCTGGEQLLGAAALASGNTGGGATYVEADSAYENVDDAAELLDDVKPTYPSSLLKTGREGTVRARFVIGTDGQVDVRSVRILASPDPQFSEAVRDALHRKVYRPARVDGRAVRSVVIQDFNFSIAAAK